MNNISEVPLKALVWIIIPEDIIGVGTDISTWLDTKTSGWIDVLRKGAHALLDVRVIILCEKNASLNDSDQNKIKDAVEIKFGFTRVEFENVSCLRSRAPDVEDSLKCDLQNTARCDQVHRLLLIDQEGRGYPCYGAWAAVANGESDLPDQDALKEAYREGRFRGLCRECVHGHPNGNWDIFPCSRYGCQVWPTIWGGSEKYPHIQFAGNGDTNWCKYFEPDFEISLEQSRSRLERLLFDGDFWREAFLEQKRPLNHFWPKNNDKESNIIPLYSSRRGPYDFTDDTPSSLDAYPAANYFPHHPQDLGADSLSSLRERFLPICFLPHLRILYDLTPDIHLLSIILTDPFTNTEFNYRSLYRDGKSAPLCFANDSWKLLWRLPNSWPQWKRVVLNFSSAIRKDRQYHADSIQEPQEYVISLGPRTSPHYGYAKEKIDLSHIWLSNLGNWRDRADEMRNLARQFLGSTKMLPSDCYSSIFLSQANHKDRSAGLDTWDIMDKNSAKCLFYLSDDNDSWVPCFSGSISDVYKERFGCSLLNYLIWARAIFGDNLGAIETFNSTNVSRNKPSQFVAYSSTPLDAVARARLKLTLATLLQPIEGTYAIYSEMASARAKLNLEKKDAEISAKKSAIRHYGHTMGHRIAPVVSFFRQHDQDSEVAGCARMVADLSLILQAFASESKQDFFRLNADKGNRFVAYDVALDLLMILRSDIGKITPKDVAMSSGVIYRYPIFDIALDKAVIQLDLDDVVQNRKCRLHYAFFAQLLSELITNALQHGYQSDSDVDASGLKAGVRIHLSSYRIDDKPALVISNYYTTKRKPAPDFFTKAWSAWPRNRENDGPGMAIAIFRALEAGDMKLMAQAPDKNEPGMLHVALILKGLEIS
jgi:hypothetical protein